MTVNELLRATSHARSDFSALKNPTHSQRLTIEPINS